MQFGNEYRFTLHTLPSDMGVILTNSVYCIVYQRGISFEQGYKCGMYDGVPLMLPRSEKIKAYIDEVMTKVQSLIDGEKISKFMLHICVGNLQERWIFDLNLKDMSCPCNAVPEMSDIVLKITSITCCLPLVQKRSRIYFVIEKASPTVDIFDNREVIGTDIQNYDSMDKTANIHESARDYLVRCYPTD